jgi:transposase
MRNITLVKHEPKQTIESMFRKEKDPRLKERLLAILNFYDGMTIAKTAAITRRSESSVKRYIRKWNKDGYNGLAAI